MDIGISKYFTAIRSSSILDERRKFLQSHIDNLRGLNLTAAKNKGGVGNSTVAVNVAIALYEFVSPLGKRVALIEGDLKSPNIGDYTSQEIQRIPYNLYLEFFQKEIPLGEEGKALFDSLYEVPEHKGFYIGAVPNIQHAKNLLNRHTDKESYEKLSRGIKLLESEGIDFTVVDLGTGKNQHEVLGFWNRGDVRIVTHTTDLESILDAAGLIQTSQLDSAVAHVLSIREKKYSEDLSKLETEVSKYERNMENIRSKIDEHDHKILELETEIVKYESELDRKRSTLHELRKIYKGKQDNEQLNSVKESIATLQMNVRELNKQIKSYNERKKILLTENEQNISDITQLEIECNRYRGEIIKYKTEFKREENDLWGLASLSELIKYYQNVSGLESGRTDMLAHDTQFTFQPTIVLPNRIRFGFREYKIALTSFGIIKDILESEGFSTKSLVPTGFFIPEAEYVRQSNNDGIPLIWNESTSSRYITNRYRDLVFKIIKDYGFKEGLRNDK